jgi:hypothetical protein
MAGLPPPIPRLARQEAQGSAVQRGPNVGPAQPVNPIALSNNIRLAVAQGQRPVPGPVAGPVAGPVPMNLDGGARRLKKRKSLRRRQRSRVTRRQRRRS